MVKNFKDLLFNPIYYIMQLFSCWLCLMGTLNDTKTEQMSGYRAWYQCKKAGPCRLSWKMNGLVQPISLSMPMPVNMERFTAF
jgi:hypothetical protein